jgi:methyl-accepting chemotaxis protein
MFTATQPERSTERQHALAPRSLLGEWLNRMIASAVTHQSTTTDEIARTVIEAADGAAGISETSGGVAKAARATSGGAADTEHAAEELAHTAAELRELVAGLVV